MEDPTAPADGVKVGYEEKRVIMQDWHLQSPEREMRDTGR
jgi:hypothetical protein